MEDDFFEFPSSQPVLYLGLLHGGEPRLVMVLHKGLETPKDLKLSSILRKAYYAFLSYNVLVLSVWRTTSSSSHQPASTLSRSPPWGGAATCPPQLGGRDWGCISYFFLLVGAVELDGTLSVGAVELDEALSVGAEIKIFC